MAFSGAFPRQDYCRFVSREGGREGVAHWILNNKQLFRLLATSRFRTMYRLPIGLAIPTVIHG